MSHLMRNEGMPAEPLQPPPVVSETEGTQAFRSLSAPLVFIVLSLALLLLYLPGIHGPYFGDDFQFVFSPTSGVLRFFISANPQSGWYRPLEAIYLALVQRYFGWDTVPIHFLAILLHAALCCLVFVALKRSGSTLAQTVLASGYMAVSQANAFAVLSNDTLSQIGATLFGCLSVWSLLCSDKPASGRSRLVTAPYWLSVAALA